jgi:hypothetical protein
VKHIGRYLLHTKDKGLKCKPNRHAVNYADSDFAGNWNPVIAAEDWDTARSQSGYVIKSAGVPLTWGLKLQTETALSDTEAKYSSLSTALREVILKNYFLQ